MRTTLAAVMGATALAVPVANAVAATRNTAKTTAKHKTVAKKKVAAKKTVTRKASGITADVSRWGTVQVVVTAKITTAANGKKTIRYTDLGGQYSYHTDRSQYIMSQSLPLLRQEFLSLQSANLQNVSGATDTSYAFMQSLQSALLKLRK